jgi:hypothetical protein
MKEKEPMQINEPDLLKRAHYLGQLLKRDKHKFLFSGFPEAQLFRFFKQKELLQTFTPDCSLKSHQMIKTHVKLSLRRHLESFLIKMEKRIAATDKLKAWNHSFADFEHMSDEQLVVSTRQILLHAQDQPEFYKDFRLNAATNESIEMIASQFAIAIEEEKEAIFQRIHSDIARSAAAKELNESLQELCTEGKRIWQNVSPSNLHDYVICHNEFVHVNHSSHY